MDFPGVRGVETMRKAELFGLFEPRVPQNRMAEQDCFLHFLMAIFTGKSRIFAICGWINTY